MRGISSSPSCSSSLGNRIGLDTTLDGSPLSSEAIFESTMLERRSTVFLAVSNIFNGFIVDGGGFIDSTDTCSLSSTGGRALFCVGQLSVGRIVEVLVIEISGCTICGWEGGMDVNPRVDNTLASS